METENQTGIIQFHFQPFTTHPGMRQLIFWTFLILFLLSLFGNATIVLIIYTTHSLHTPMYYFLANLACLEIAYSCTIAPLTLAHVASARKVSITLAGCGTQMFFFTFLGSSDCVLIAIMAYDRYVAICHPLSYTVIMNWRVCVKIVVWTLAMTCFFGIQLSILILTLPFCVNKEINIFFCDVPVVMKLACGDTHFHQTAFFIVSITVITIPFLLICISYAFIVAAVLRISSAAGRQRAFSTCSSHLMVVLLQYGCGSLIYLRPSSSYSPEEGRAVSVVYTFVTPVLNPLIYSMRNKELKDALIRTLKRAVLPQRK
uniref:Olfactory receptor n=1 Tax=Podarcis muralis TaxID=64176 RepID=A0A670HMY3_PODMU|nr:olfactory receptor 10V1-like [Podarcis muralis]